MRDYRQNAFAQLGFALLLLCVVACERPTGPRFPADAEQYEPLEIYAEWWRMVAACSGTTRDFNEVRWYHAPRASIVATLGRRAGAFYTETGSRVVITSERVSEGPLVRHEMLHALHRVGGHPRSLFMDRCAGLVSCDGDCLKEAGAAPVAAASIRRVPSESLVVWNEVRPSAPRAAIWGGFFVFTVRVRNPYDEPVVVQLAPSGDAGAPLSFRYRFESSATNGSFNVRADDGAVYLFAPREEKEMVFDFSVAPTQSHSQLVVGEWTLRGWFGDNEASPVRVSIAP